MEISVPIQLEQNITNTNLIIKSLVNDIKTCNGSTEELKKLNGFGRIKISFLRELIDKLETYAIEESDNTVKKRLLNVVKSEKDQLYSTLKDFQKANVDSMLSIEKSNLEELFAVSNPDEVLRRRYTRNNATLLLQSSEISDHMSSVSRLLADVVKESSGALETLVKSSTNITGIQEELKTTGSIIDQSGKILNKYQQRELTDKFLIFFAFAFFIACVLYVIYSRI